MTFAVPPNETERFESAPATAGTTSAVDGKARRRATRIERAGPDRPRFFFTREFRPRNPTGTPRAIAWFGFRSFWGHLRRLIASVIATDDVDTRDWMEPTSPPQLATRVTNALGVEPRHGTLVENLGRDLWIDFVADTGDDGEVSQRVGEILFRSYVVPDPRDPERTLEAPRGDVLVHGGDLAYPVGTATQIHDRVIVPWNRVLRKIPYDGKPRVLLGVPGNHDWYDGIDGYARMFRERHFVEEPEAPTTPIDLGTVSATIRFVGSFLAGQTAHRTHALVLSGYTPVQRASYFVLPLLPGIDFYAVDRHLRTVDYRQKRFFQEWRRRNPSAKRVVLLHDPVLPFGRPSESGVKMLGALELSPSTEKHLVLAGDIHHYRRESVGDGIHVTAGGGGAFLHPAPIAPSARAKGNPAEVEWPGPRQSRALLAKVPLHVAFGRAGHIPHAVLTAVFAPVLGLGGYQFGTSGLIWASVAAGLAAAIVMALIGGIRRGPAGPIAALATLAGLATGAVPALTLQFLERLPSAIPIPSDTVSYAAIALVTAVGAGATIFGTFLALLTALGLEHTQALTALSSAGFRHFVRLRVRVDGSGLDVFCIGLEDPLAPREQPVLVDSFAWNVTPPPDSRSPDNAEGTGD